MNKRAFPAPWKILSIFTGLMLLAWVNLTLSAGRVQALTPGQAGATPTVTPTAAPPPDEQPITSASPHATGDCFACHSQAGMTGMTKDGDEYSLYFDKFHYQDILHSNCVFCHVNQKSYPHDSSPTQSCAVCHWEAAGAPAPDGPLTFQLPYEDTRTIALEINASCMRCHGEAFKEIETSVHTRTMSKDNRFAPVCVDCHTPHVIKIINRQYGAQLCSKCHLAQTIAYESSVHGTALKAENNQDVPICDDCHGAHSVIGPRDAAFRLDAFEMCGKCHADENRMRKYNISTDVLSTYLDDFHGRSSDLFGKPGAAKITKAACYDCHGVHNILSPENPESKVAAANLQRTCQECHPDANANFPAAWLGHKRVSIQDEPALFALQLFLILSVSAVVVFFVAYISLDIGKRRATRKAEAAAAETKSENEEGKPQ